MSSPTDIAWAAGLFEGEGFLVRRPVGRRVYIELGIEMRDLDVVERFVAVLEPHLKRTNRTAGPQQIASIRTRYRNENNPKHSDTATWKIVGNTAEQAFLLLRPHLGKRRTAKGDQILAEAHALRETLLEPRNCEVCGTAFPMRDYGHSKRFCSSQCSYTARTKKPGYRASENARKQRHRDKKRAAAILAD